MQFSDIVCVIGRYRRLKGFHMPFHVLRRICRWSFLRRMLGRFLWLCLRILGNLFGGSCLVGWWRQSGLPGVRMQLSSNLQTNADYYWLLIWDHTIKTVLEVIGKNKTLTPKANPKETKKLTSSSFGKYQTGNSSGKKYPKVNPTFVIIAYITTLNINLGYLYHQRPHTQVRWTARNELIAKILKKRNTAATAAALELYKSADPGGWVCNFACRQHHRPKIVTGTARQLKKICLMTDSMNLPRGIIAKVREEMMAIK